MRIEMDSKFKFKKFQIIRKKHYIKSEISIKNIKISVDEDLRPSFQREHFTIKLKP